MSLKNQNVAVEMAVEARAMASYALSHGIAVPGWVLETLARVDDGIEAPEAGDGDAGSAVTAREIHRAHSELGRLIAPFTPDLVVMLEMESKVSNFMKALGQVRIARFFVIAALTSLVLFMAVSVSPYLNDPKYGDITQSWGFPLFVNEVFYLSSAAVGASFAGLFRLDRELCDGTFLPKDQSSYWVQFTLGIVAGLLLATLFQVRAAAPSDDVAHTSMQFSGAALALLGGFSSSVVQRLIQRLIEALETILRGAAAQELRARDAAHKVRLEEQLAKERVRTSLWLADMQRQVGAGEDPEALREKLEAISQSVFTSGVPAVDEPTEERPARAPKSPREMPSLRPAKKTRGRA